MTALPDLDQVAAVLVAIAIRMSGGDDQGGGVHADTGVLPSLD